AATLARLRDMVGADFLPELIAQFLGETPRLLAEMREAIARGDSASLRRLAHTVKTTSVSFGALRLTRCCKELEALSGAGALDGTAEPLAQAESQFEQLRMAL